MVSGQRDSGRDGSYGVVRPCPKLSDSCLRVLVLSSPEVLLRLEKLGVLLESVQHSRFSVHLLHGRWRGREGRWLLHVPVGRLVSHEGRADLLGVNHARTVIERTQDGLTHENH